MDDEIRKKLEEAEQSGKYLVHIFRIEPKTSPSQDDTVHLFRKLVEFPKDKLDIVGELVRRDIGKINWGDQEVPKDLPKPVTPKMFRGMFGEETSREPGEDGL